MNKEKQLLELQLITTIIFVISLIVSTTLTYDELLKQDKKQLFNDKTSDIISIANRVVVLVLSLSFLYINYQNRNIAKRKGKNIKFQNLQINASQLSTIASIITLYVVIASGRYTITSIENPTL